MTRLCLPGVPGLATLIGTYRLSALRWPIPHGWHATTPAKRPQPRVTRSSRAGPLDYAYVRTHAPPAVLERLAGLWELLDAYAPGQGHPPGAFQGLWEDALGDAEIADAAEVACHADHSTAFPVVEGTVTRERWRLRVQT